jgi:hypothetical protein
MDLRIIPESMIQNITNVVPVFFYFTNFIRTLVILGSFPDVVGTFTPTVRSTLVNAVSTLRITEVVSPTHTNANTLIYTKAGFLPFYIISQNRLWHLDLHT